MAEIQQRFCRNGHSWLEDLVRCPSCSEKWRRSRWVTVGRLSDEAARRQKHGGPSPNINTFKPYVEDGFTGEPILVETKDQRDQLCRAHHLTYDSYSKVEKPNTPPAIDSIDFGDVKDALEHGIPASETELDLPEAPIPVVDD